MVLFCMALGCNNQSKIRKDLSFYRLPLKNEEMLTKWLVNLKKTRLPKLLDNCYVCSDHFEVDCFGRDLKAELLGEKPKPPLAEDAVPTLFSHNNFKADHKKRVFSELRKVKKEKEQMLKDLLGPYYDMKLMPPGDVIKEEAANEYSDDTYSIQSLLPITEIACQTDHKCTMEMSCQTDKPCLVTTATQWSEKDFLPDPEVVEQEHTYCKKRRVSVAIQVETLRVPTTRASKAKARKTKRKYTRRKKAVRATQTQTVLSRLTTHLTESVYDVLEQTTERSVENADASSLPNWSQYPDPSTFCIPIGLL